MMNCKTEIVIKTSKAGNPYKNLRVWFSETYYVDFYINDDKAEIIEMKFKK